MTSVDHVTRILPGSPEWADLRAHIAAGTKDRDLNDENPFDQVAALKRAGFGTLRLPEHRGGAGFTVPQLFSAVIDVAHADPIVAHISGRISGSSRSGCVRPMTLARRGGCIR